MANQTLVVYLLGEIPFRPLFNWKTKTISLGMVSFDFVVNKGGKVIEM